MKFSTSLMVFLGFVLVSRSFAVPISVVENDLSNSLEGEGEEEEEEEEEEEDMPPMILDDDFTTHGLERLSSAATCLVAGVEYTHGQQIYRSDPCEFCLCLDGEMFCWWQDCPPAVEGPCKDRGPFSPCTSIPVSPPMSLYNDPESDLVVANLKKPATAKNKKNSTNNNSASSQMTQPSYSSHTTAKSNSAQSSTQVYTSTEKAHEIYSSTVAQTSTSKVLNHCVIMGKIYQVGDKLPHDTGNCLECVCGPGPKVTCSPHQCAPGGMDDTNEFRVPGIVSQQAQGMF